MFPAPTRCPGENSARALGDTLDAARTLQGLRETILVLARLQAGQMKPELDLIAMKPVLAQHWAQVRGTAGQRGLVFEDRGAADTVVNADPKLLDVVLPNVLSNAATCTPDGGRITFEARPAEKSCTLSIANIGCQLSKADVARVFDRFWRADAARVSRSNLHCGLGLTLVRRAMEAMGGQAQASVTEDHRFILTLAFHAAE